MGAVGWIIWTLNADVLEHYPTHLVTVGCRRAVTVVAVPVPLFRRPPIRLATQWRSRRISSRTIYRCPRHSSCLQGQLDVLKQIAPLYYISSFCFRTVARL
jgi:hypothetical protein